MNGRHVPWSQLPPGGIWQQREPVDDWHSTEGNSENQWMTGALQRTTLQHAAVDAGGGLLHKVGAISIVYIHSVLEL